MLSLKKTVVRTDKRDDVNRRSGLNRNEKDVKMAQNSKEWSKSLKRRKRKESSKSPKHQDLLDMKSKKSIKIAKNQNAKNTKIPQKNKITKK
jgi:hypothetical protein